MRVPLLILAAVLTTSPAVQAQWGFGAEGNEQQSYVWVTRYQPFNLGNGNQIVGWATGSWRSYEPSPLERISGPGLAAGATLRRTTSFWSGGIGAGWDVRWLDRSVEGVRSDETASGPALLGDFSARLGDRSVFNVGANYWGADEWLSSSANLLYELTPRLRLGPEVGFDGNGDLDVRRYGAIAGIPQGRGWLYFRGGQATTEDRFGNERTEPYFSVGISGGF